MLYRYLGNSGLRVSILGFGNWITGSRDQEEIQIEILKKAFKAGINFFDTAEVYGNGVAEEIMGKAIKHFGCTREQIVVSTKLWQSGSGSVNETFLSRKHVLEGINNSLRRLDLKYVDIVFAHRPDYETPLEEICRAFHSVIEQGKAFYWGTSEWPVEMIIEAFHVCEKFNLHRPIAEQCQYNLFARDRMEKEYSWLFSKYRYGTTIWSPLAGGILSGKYNDGIIPAGSRMHNDAVAKGMTWPQYFGPSKRQQTVESLKGLAELAQQLKCTQSQLALAWTLANTDTSTCLLGASKLAQLEDNLGALDLLKHWNPEIEEKCDKIFHNTPKTELNWRMPISKIPGRRTVSLVPQAKKAKL